MTWTVLVVATVVLIGAASLSAQDAPPEVIARNLAQNVLGEGTVRHVRVLAGGRQIEITWDAVLYRPANTREKNREQLRGEAELATGSIMGIMKPDVIRFAMLLGQRRLAQGVRTRDGTFMINYAKELGG